ncbi:hypothetical protein E2C01_063180 [Portunus trituberculatus]|uniref:Uncharacterized protein n=1 Tax=Portunus trituberculatus TaxID=210409 RepID=A0A5B7HI96_PORTR|nr:hypothetical protein [Portunus trituberculatus]
MPALGSEGSPSARARILSTVRVKAGLPHSRQRFPSGRRNEHHLATIRTVVGGSRCVGAAARDARREVLAGEP